MRPFIVRALLCTAIEFAWFVWPTPWVYGYQVECGPWTPEEPECRLVEIRKHRILGFEQRRYEDGEWGAPGCG